MGTSAKTSLEKTLLSMDTQSASHHLFLAAEHLEAGGLYTEMPMAIPGRKRNKWDYKSSSTYQSHLERAMKIDDSSFTRACSGALAINDDYRAAMEEFDKAVDLHRHSKERNGAILSLIAHLTSKVTSLNQTYQVIDEIAQKHARAFSQENPAYHALLHVGFDHVRNEEFKQATAIFEEADKIFAQNGADSNEQGYGSVGVVFALLKQGKWKEAEQHMQEIECPDKSALDALSAIFYTQKGLHEEALSLFEQSKKEEPRNLQAYRHNWCSPSFYQLMPTVNYWHAFSLKGLDREEEAISLLRKTLQRYPEAKSSFEIENLLGRLYLQTDQKEQARPHLERGVSQYFRQGVKHHSIFQNTPGYMQHVKKSQGSPTPTKKTGYILTVAALTMLAGSAAAYMKKPEIVAKFCYPEYQEERVNAAHAHDLSKDINIKLSVFIWEAQAKKYQRSRTTYAALSEPLQEVQGLMKGLQNFSPELQQASGKLFCPSVNEWIENEFTGPITEVERILLRVKENRKTYAHVFIGDKV